MTAVLNIPEAGRKFSIAQGPVQTAQIAFELDCLIALYRARAPKRVLEIGTFCGGTLYRFLQASQPGTQVVTVDNLEAAPDNRELFDAWCPDGVTCEPVIGDSHSEITHSIVSKFGPFDLIFIDGLHTYDAVRQDWDDYRKLAAPGAVIGLHDICLVRDYPETGETAGVSRLWREIQRAGGVTQEIVCQPEQTEYGIGLYFCP